MEGSGSPDLPRPTDSSSSVAKGPSIGEGVVHTTIDPEKAASLDRGFMHQVRSAIDRIRFGSLPTQPTELTQTQPLQTSGDSTIDPVKLAGLEDRLSADAKASIQNAPGTSEDR